MNGRRFTFLPRTLLWLFPRREHLLVNRSNDARRQGHRYRQRWFSMIQRRQPKPRGVIPPRADCAYESAYTTFLSWASWLTPQRSSKADWFKLTSLVRRQIQSATYFEPAETPRYTLRYTQGQSCAGRFNSVSACA
jgi:hypothetical protein